jgi:hypothetical protein|tara:strand:+ start:1329 stop:1499 length:171 start_codon:yes stop_codon:yes gene_type:complete
MKLKNEKLVIEDDIRKLKSSIKLTNKINYLLDIVIAFSIGASITFAFVVIHQMLTT